MRLLDKSYLLSGEELMDYLPTFKGLTENPEYIQVWFERVK